VPLCVIDNETMSFLAINDAALRQYGYTREESQGKTLKAIFFEEDFPGSRNFLTPECDIPNGSSTPWCDIAGKTFRHLARGQLAFPDLRRPTGPHLPRYDVTRSKHAEEDCGSPKQPSTEAKSPSSVWRQTASYSTSTNLPARAWDIPAKN